MNNTIIEQQKTVDNSKKIFDSLWETKPVQKTINTTRSGRIITTLGREFLQNHALELITTARETLFISTFLLSSEAVEKALMQAAKKGVRIYLLSSTDAVLDQDFSDETNEFDRKRVDKHIALLKTLSGNIQVRSSRSFHAKFILSDAKSSSRGCLFTCNLTKEALVRNPELGIKLTPGEVQELAGLFVFSFWEKADKELKGSSVNQIKSENRISLPDRRSLLATCASRKDILEQTLSILKSAGKEIIITTFGIGHEKIIDALCRKAQNGVKVTLLTRETRKGQLETIQKLENAGIQVIGIPYFHAKSLLVDSRKGIITTANFEYHGLEDGFEIGVLLNEAECADLRRMYDSWLTGKHFQFFSQKSLEEINNPFKIWTDKGMRRMAIEETKTFDCGTLQQKCLTHPKPEPDFNKYRLPGDTEVKKIIYKWNIQLPLLSGNARPYIEEETKQNKKKKDNGKKVENKKITYPCPIFIDNGKKVFVVKNTNEAEKAKQFMKQYKIQAIVLEK